MSVQWRTVPSQCLTVFCQFNSRYDHIWSWHLETSYPISILCMSWRRNPVSWSLWTLKARWSSPIWDWRYDLLSDSMELSPSREAICCAATRWTRRFITILTADFHWYLSWTTSIQSIRCHVSKINLISSTHLHSDFLVVYFAWRSHQYPPLEGKENLKVFWRWYVTQSWGLFTFPPIWNLNFYKIESFRKSICFCPEERRERHILLGPLERFNLKHEVVW
jgi:hypothetical protein